MYSRLPKEQEQYALSRQNKQGIHLHEKAQDMPNLPVARFTRMPDGDKILAFSCDKPDGSLGKILVTDDCGESWKVVAHTIDSGVNPAPSGAFLCTKEGTLIAAFANRAEKANWHWDGKIKDSPGAELPTYAARSTDGGKTWGCVQKLHPEWTGATRDIIQTRDGRIVFTSMKLLHNPGRHTIMTYVSDDDGKSWEPSNLIDLGGNGHHGGVTEATLVELKNGNLLKYIRTNWGQFWRAVSVDGGMHWHPYGPAGIDASSAPGMLQRLKSGRIVLAWNRFYPAEKQDVQLKGGDGVWSATPSSNFREELAVSFSEDECETWTPPVIVARNPGSEVSYPQIFEPNPGVLWITAWRFGLSMQIRECDFI